MRFTSWLAAGNRHMLMPSMLICLCIKVRRLGTRWLRGKAHHNPIHQHQLNLTLTSACHCFIVVAQALRDGV